MVPKVDRNSLVPVSRSDILEAMTVVTGSVVNQHAGSTMSGCDPCDGGLQSGNVGKVAGVVDGGMRDEGRDACDECGGRLIGDVEERYASALLRELLHGRRADALSASRDQNEFAGETWVGGEFAHAVSANQRRQLVADAE